MKWFWIFTLTGCGLFATPSRADRAELTIEGLRVLCDEFKGKFPPKSPPELEAVCNALTQQPRSH